MAQRGRLILIALLLILAIFLLVMSRLPIGDRNRQPSTPVLYLYQPGLIANGASAP